tara:strand:+ start:2537 stop:3682 length:1146 start_codon:yes stop_codon:yes gene_type:complete
MTQNIKNLANLDTPCLILDKEILKTNCKNVLLKCKELQVNLRPHVKTPKCIEVVKVALNNETGPITVSTLKEAEYFASSKFKDILYAVGIVPSKLSRIAKIQNKFNCVIKIILDSVEVAKAVANYANSNNVNLEILVEIDSGEGRSGIRPNDKKLKEIVSVLKQNNNTHLMGVMTHAGHSYNSNNPKTIKAIANKEKEDILHAANNLKKLGNPCPIVSLGSTPTIFFGSNFDGISEVRCGVYMFWDLAQASRNVCKIEDIAVTVLSSVINHNYQDKRIILDAGALALSKDISANKFMPNAGYGLVCDKNTAIPLTNLNVSEVHQEHGTINITNEKWFDYLPIGSLVRIKPNHSCLTCAGHETYNILENNSISGLWRRINGW